MRVDKEILEIREFVLNTRALKILINSGYSPYHCGHFKLIWIKGGFNYNISSFLVSNNYCDFIEPANWPTARTMPDISFILNIEGDHWQVRRLEVGKVVEVFRG